MEQQNKNNTKTFDNSDVTVDRIVNVVYGFYGIDPATKNSRSRRVSQIKPKHVSMYLIKNHLPMTITSIGECFGAHHATVIHACKKVIGYLEYDKAFYQEIHSIEKKLLTESNQKIFVIGSKTIVMSGFTKEELKEFMAINGLTEEK